MGRTDVSLPPNPLIGSGVRAATGVRRDGVPNPRNGRWTRLLRLLWPVLLVGPVPAIAQLRADELLLVYNQESEDSRRLAEHYADVRRVPPSQRLGLSMPLAESISREQYLPIAASVRAFLRGSADGSRIRCLVTFRDVPLKVGAPTPTASETAKRQELQTLRDQARQKIAELLADMERTLGEKPRPAAADTPKLDKLVERYRELRKLLAWQTQRKDADVPSDFGPRLLGFIEAAEGAGAVVTIMRESIERRGDAGLAAPDEAVAGQLAQIAQAEQTVKVASVRLADLHDLGPMSANYQEAMKLLPGARGWLGTYAWLDADIERLAGNDCHAAFDSELSMVLWDSYSLYRWQPNLLNPDVAQRVSREHPPRTLMVSRLDAPTVAVVRRMIDDAVAVEAVGLSGKAYVDVRRMTGRDEYAEYDSDLMDLYGLLRDKTTIPTRVDLEAGVFPVGCCDDAALYCGWYSVSKYVPAFRFARGAVGFHIASFELKTLRPTDSTPWCAGLLNDGVVATLGPTSEPYLGAFPKPSKFFSLLLRGRYTLAECFYRTSPYNSWQMALLGDPLYRPFAVKPALIAETQDKPLPPKP